MKLEIKNGGREEEKRQQLKHGLRNNSIEMWRGQGGNFAWKNFDHSMALS